MAEIDQVPVRVGDEITVEIHGYANQGEGVGRYRGFTIFVPDCLDGEQVLTRIELVKKITPGVSSCGCCRNRPTGWRRAVEFTAAVAVVSFHMKYSAQLAFKRRRVIE